MDQSGQEGMWKQIQEAERAAEVQTQGETLFGAYKPESLDAFEAYRQVVGDLNACFDGGTMQEQMEAEKRLQASFGPNVDLQRLLQGSSILINQGTTEPMTEQHREAEAYFKTTVMEPILNRTGATNLDEIAELNRVANQSFFNHLKPSGE